MKKNIFTIRVHEDLTDVDGPDFVAAVRLLSFIAARHKSDIVFIGDKPDGSEVSMPMQAGELNAAWVSSGKGEN